MLDQSSNVQFVTDEAALLARAREGDLDAFAEIVRRFERPVRALLGRLLDDERDVAEAAQDTFVQAWRNLDRFRGDAAPFTWLYRIAVNEALQRARRKRPPVSPLDEVEGQGGEAVADASGQRDLPELAAEHRELTDLLGRRLRALPFDLRAPVVLRDVMGWSNQEVADALRLSLPAAKSRIHRARMQLRADLEPWLRGRD
jgi:RNA polymerase sigma-70 factor (ECF subfamily)